MAMLVREVPCEICDTVEDVNSFCLTCKQTFCDKCKKGHLRTVFTKHHKFASVGDSLIASVRGNELCTLPQQENTFYCNTCSKTTCPVCLTENHKRHDLSLVSQLITEVKKEAEKQLIQKRELVDKITESDKTLLRNFQQESDDLMAATTKMVKEWADCFKIVEDHLIQVVKDTTETELQTLEDRRKTLEKEKQKIDEVLNDISTWLCTSSGVSLLQKKADFISRIDGLTITIPAQIMNTRLPELRLIQTSKEAVKSFMLSDSTPH